MGKSKDTKPRGAEHTKPGAPGQIKPGAPDATKVGGIKVTTEDEERAAAAAAQHEQDKIDAENTPAADGLDENGHPLGRDGKPVDPLDPAQRFRLALPTSPLRLYIHVAKAFGIEGRQGDGPCAVAKKFVLPCGDYVIPGDTFDPLVERMAPARFNSLRARKFFEVTDKGVLERLAKAHG